MTQRFEKAYNSLYNAFMNDTLAKGTCVACAVGNILADALGGKISKKGYEFACSISNTWWNTFFITVDNEQTIFDDNNDIPAYGRLKDLTGYSVEELAKIEFAFETNTKIRFINYPFVTEERIMEDQFRGLMAVMDVMIELDNIEEGRKYKETFKNKFIHEY
jgi:hypothetical protein